MMVPAIQAIAVEPDKVRANRKVAYPVNGKLRKAAMLKTVTGGSPNTKSGKKSRLTP